VCSPLFTPCIWQGIPVELIHNASVMGAAGCCGLHLYQFGKTVSIPFFTEGWRPTSFHPTILYNRRGDMHTLCLLDIKVREPDFEAMKKGRTEFLPPRYMSVNCALEQMLEAAEGSEDKAVGAYTKDTLCVGMARLGQTDECIKAGSLEELIKEDFGEPLHCLVLCAEDVHELELEALDVYILDGSIYKGSHKK